MRPQRRSEWGCGVGFGGQPPHPRQDPRVLDLRLFGDGFAALVEAGDFGWRRAAADGADALGLLELAAQGVEVVLAQALVDELVAATQAHAALAVEDLAVAGGFAEAGRFDGAGVVALDLFTGVGALALGAGDAFLGAGAGVAVLLPLLAKLAAGARRGGQLAGALDAAAGWGLGAAADGADAAGLLELLAVGAEFFLAEALVDGLVASAQANAALTKEGLALAVLLTGAGFAEGLLVVGFDGLAGVGLAALADLVADAGLKGRMDEAAPAAFFVADATIADLVAAGVAALAGHAGHVAAAAFAGALGQFEAFTGVTAVKLGAEHAAIGALAGVALDLPFFAKLATAAVGAKLALAFLTADDGGRGSAVADGADAFGVAPGAGGVVEFFLREVLVDGGVAAADADAAVAVEELAVFVGLTGAVGVDDFGVVVFDLFAGVEAGFFGADGSPGGAGAGVAVLLPGFADVAPRAAFTKAARALVADGRGGLGAVAHTVGAFLLREAGAERDEFFLGKVLVDGLVAAAQAHAALAIEDLAVFVRVAGAGGLDGRLIGVFEFLAGIAVVGVVVAGFGDANALLADQARAAVVVRGALDVVVDVVVLIVVDVIVFIVVDVVVVVIVDVVVAGVVVLFDAAFAVFLCAAGRHGQQADRQECAP